MSASTNDNKIFRVGIFIIEAVKISTKFKYVQKLVLTDVNFLFFVTYLNFDFKKSLIVALIWKSRKSEKLKFCWSRNFKFFFKN